MRKSLTILFHTHRFNIRILARIFRTDMHESVNNLKLRFLLPMKIQAREPLLLKIANFFHQEVAGSLSKF